MSHLPGKFVWFEHVSPDVAQARAFYERVMGWQVAAMPVGEMTYQMIMSGGEGIGGFRTAPPGLASHWNSYLSVTDVDASHAASLAAGAKSLLAPVDFGPIGRGAAVCDPTGAQLSLWKSAQGDRPDMPATPFGDWIWNELWTADAGAALAFYEGVFGYTHDTMDMGAQGSYHMLKQGAHLRAGVMQMPPGTPTLWCPYVHVADCDAGVTAAREAGAQVMLEPQDIAGVGRVAILVDPFGASIGVMRSHDAL